VSGDGLCKAKNKKYIFNFLTSEFLKGIGVDCSKKYLRHTDFQIAAWPEGF